MPVPAAEGRLIQHTFGQNLPEGHHHRQICLKRSELLLAAFVMFDPLRSEDP
jgi:hypothetical protein